MKYSKLLLVAVSILFFSTIDAQVENKTFFHDGVDREYIVYTPSSYDGIEPLPLLFCFHGFTSSANVIMLYSGINNLAESEGFIVVYPQGLLFGGNTHWNVGGFTLGSTVDDVDFIDKLLDDLILNYSIEESRVYSTGMSNGGFMSFLLACQLSDRFAAVASVTGSMTPQTFDQCNPERTVPVLQIHGDDDRVVPYNGAIWTKSIDDVMAYWSTHNNCDETSDLFNVNDSNTSDGSTVEQYVFDNGNQCSSVVHYKIKGGDHDWPGAWGNMDINGSNEVWTFLSQYDLDGLIGCITSNTQSAITFDNYIVFPNPSFDVLHVNMKEPLSKPYKLLNINGSIIKSGIIANLINQISIEDLNTGLYYLKVEDQIFEVVKL